MVSYHDILRLNSNASAPLVESPIHFSKVSQAGLDTSSGQSNQNIGFWPGLSKDPYKKFLQILSTTKSNPPTTPSVPRRRAVRYTQQHG